MVKLLTNAYNIASYSKHLGINMIRKHKQESVTQTILMAYMSINGKYGKFKDKVYFLFIFLMLHHYHQFTKMNATAIRNGAKSLTRFSFF